MATRVRLAGAGDVAPGEGRVVEAEGRSMALFNVDGHYYAIDNVCPHRGGPLGEGELDGTTVICPWHGWRYNVATGENELIPNLPTEKFEVKVEEDDVLVDLA